MGAEPSFRSDRRGHLSDRPAAQALRAISATPPNSGPPVEGKGAGVEQGIEAVKRSGSGHHNVPSTPRPEQGEANPQQDPRSRTASVRVPSRPGPQRSRR
jgi:hypothetical protein